MPLMRRAANDIDRLSRGERRALGSILLDLARGLAGSTTRSLGRQTPKHHPAGSPEATICFLAQHDWFGRRSRAQTSWWKNRGAF
mmetsp:Transcript_115007/g.371898  ORF Transcript_115007/g.371898 Transcript_115007/m.371898 type:complete len:85 (+) Transcript_115007:421-675(+)